jgi:hypothetical protein
MCNLIKSQDTTIKVDNIISNTKHRLYKLFKGGSNSLLLFFCKFFFTNVTENSLALAKTNHAFKEMDLQKGIIRSAGNCTTPINFTLP